MRRMNGWPACLVAVLMAVSGGCSGTRNGDNDPRENMMINPLGPPVRIESAGNVAAAQALVPLKFLVGTRRSVTPAIIFEETILRAQGPGMIGVSRVYKADGSPRMYELFTITHEPSAEDPDAVFMRLRHFSRVLVANEDAAAPIVLKLMKADGKHAVFAAQSGDDTLDRIEYVDQGGGRMQASVHFKNGAKPTITLDFQPAE